MIASTWGWDEVWQEADFDRRFAAYEVSIGIGRVVIEPLLLAHAHKGLPVTLAVVPASPRAQRFYERLGFRVISVEAPFIRMQRDQEGQGGL